VLPIRPTERTLRFGWAARQSHIMGTQRFASQSCDWFAFLDVELNVRFVARTRKICRTFFSHIPEGVIMTPPAIDPIASHRVSATTLHDSMTAHRTVLDESAPTTATNRRSRQSNAVHTQSTVRFGSSGLQRTRADNTSRLDRSFLGRDMKNTCDASPYRNLPNGHTKGVRMSALASWAWVGAAWRPTHPLHLQACLTNEQLRHAISELQP